MTSEPTPGSPCLRATRHSVSWCVLPVDHEGGHRSVLGSGHDVNLVLAWPASARGDEADPLVVAVSP